MKLKLFVTSDIHGNLFPTNYSTRDNKENYGLARISTAIKEMRKKEDFLLMDNGDSLQGTPLLTYAHQYKDQYKNPMAQAFNYLNYDYFNLGNHDFNYGPQILNKYLKENKATLLTSNFTIDEQPPGNTQIIEKDGKKIALVGLLTQYIPRWERAEHIANMKFYSAYEHLKNEVERVSDDVDYIVALYHGGLERDPDTGEATERLTGENEGYQMTQIPELDILITGHQHRSLIKRVNNVLVTQSSFKAKEFVTIELDLESGFSSAKLHDSSKYEADENFLEQFSSLQKVTQEWLDQDIGELEGGSILIEDELDARLHKHPLVSLLNQIQLDRSGADISSVALFNGAQGFKEKFSMRDLVSTYLYPNTLVVKEMSGHAIKEMIEFSALYFVVQDNEIRPNPRYVSPKPQHYNYDMLDGISYTIHVGNKEGSRVSDLMFKGTAMDLDRNYKVVVNNYRAMGGGNYNMVAESKTIKEIQEEMVDIVMNYFLKNPVVKINHHDNIKVVI